MSYDDYEEEERQERARFNWPAQLGKTTLAGVTVSTVQEKKSAKGNTYYIVALDGYPGTVYCPDKLTPGERLDLECETSMGDRGIEQKLRKPGASKGFAGGGGFKAAKTPADIAVMNVCNINTSVASVVSVAMQMGVVKDQNGCTGLIEALNALFLSNSRAAIETLKAVVQ